MTPLYSLHGNRPAPLPFRIRLPNGRTRTDPTTFTAEEVAAAGLTGPYQEPSYDPATQQLLWVGGAYVVEALPPPPPVADWARFKLALLPNPSEPNSSAMAINAAIAQAFAAVPVGVLGLSSGLAKAEAGDHQEFSGSWRAVLAVAPPPADALAELVALAGDCNLPAEFVGAVAGQRVRARDSQGRFLPDDPATPDVDEAWV